MHWQIWTTWTKEETLERRSEDFRPGEERASEDGRERGRGSEVGVRSGRGGSGLDGPLQSLAIPIPRVRMLERLVDGRGRREDGGVVRARGVVSAVLVVVVVPGLSIDDGSVGG